MLGAQLDDVATGDPAEAVVAGGSPDCAIFDDEEVGGVAGGDEAVRIEHEGLVNAGVGGLDAGHDAVQLRVGVELRILTVRITPPHVHGEEPHAVLEGLRPGRLVFGDDDDGRG